jgi:hypothetical protein
MSRAEKLAERILSGRSDKNFAFDDLCYVLERAGFQSRSGRGSPDLLQRWSRGDRQHPAAEWESEAISVKQVRELLLKYKIDIG